MKRNIKIIILCSVFIIVCLTIGIIHFGNIKNYNENLTNNEFNYNTTPNTNRTTTVPPSRVIPIADFTITNNFPKLDGATAFEPVYLTFALYTYIDKNLDRDNTQRLSEFLNNYVYCSRTESAYEKLRRGAVDIIFCLEPSQEQLQKFIYFNLKLVPIGREAFVFFVNERNPVKNITVQSALGIYSGRITNWSEVGGINSSILAYQRPKNSGSQTILEKFMGNTPIMEPQTEIIGYMGDIIELVGYTNHNNAIGYSFLIYSSDMYEVENIRHLSINGVLPSKEAIIDNSYPFIVDFYAIYIERDEKNEHIEPFINWMLSPQGQAIVSNYGYIPINDAGICEIIDNIQPLH